MIKEAIETLVSGNSLREEQAAGVMGLIMEGEVTPAQFGALATALRIKGETVDELVGFARAMRQRAIPVATTGTVVDTCGTGGDRSGSFNISTAAALVVAGAGLKVAKHGNRAVSSACGSADVLEELGVRLELDAEGVSRCIEEMSIGFMFAPLFHPAMKRVATLRRELGIRTVFNILGPLTNPADAKHQLLGVADKALGERMALVLQRLGCRHALVVHGLNGMDEISLSGKSLIWELRGDSEFIADYYVAPEDFGLKRASLKELQGGTSQENAEMLVKILEGERGALYDIVALNAAAAIVAGDKAESLREGLELARESIESGNALEKLRGLVELSRELAKG
jgi:anthranilate phosphoribosyltransferase